jgi:hypothetical protein
MPKPALIDLDALTASDRLPKVRLFGREMTVRPLTGAAAHKIATLQDIDNSNATALLGPMLEVLAGCVPDLTAAEIDQLTVDQIAALLQLSRGQVAEVEEMLAEQATAQLAEQPAGNG